jgi:hypothetical protein
MKRPRRTSPVTKVASPALAAKPGALTADIRRLIEGARRQVAQTVMPG